MPRASDAVRTDCPNMPEGSQKYRKTKLIHMSKKLEDWTERRSIQELRITCTSSSGAAALIRARVQFIKMGYLGFIVVLALLALNAQGTWGQVLDMISIDCGAARKYTDPVTTISWTPDDEYISAGQTVAAVPVTDGSYSELGSLRYFPEKREKFCYVVPIKPNSTYIIRSSYWYGNYDQTNTPPKFNIALDSTTLGFVDMSQFGDQTLQAEVVYRTKVSATTISYCLFKDSTSKGTPFISSLVFSQVPDGSYAYPRTLEGNFMILWQRRNYGGSVWIRYPDDVLDRLWAPWVESSPLTTISTLTPVTDSGYFAKPVSKVMQTAVTSPTLSPVVLPVNSGANDASAMEATLYFYFAELDASANATSRSFLLDSQPASPTLINPYNATEGAFRSSVWGYSKFSMTSNSVVTMTPAPGSINPPLMNALEIYLNRPDAVAGTNELDVAALEKIKVALSLTGWGGDPCLPVPLSWVLCSPVTATEAARVISVRLSRYNLTGIIPVEFAELTALQTLWLDNNKLVGNIPNLQKLQQLKSLHLNDNGLSGSIPDSLSFIPTLEELFLQNNNLTGTVPDALKNKSGLNLNINGNPVCGPTCSNPGPGSKSNVGLIAGVVGGVVGVLVVGGILLFCFCRKRQTTEGMGQKLPKSNSDPYKSGGKGKGKGKGGVSNFAVPDLSGTNGQGAKPFSHAEIKAATSNFSTQIGAGGFGPVYYGKLANGREVAVKVSDMNSRQGAAEFNNEVQLLSRVHHRNLVSLLGYCQEDGKQMLVYEYLHKGTVREHLWGSPLATKEPLDWKQRLDVSLNAAQGLEYLHTGCSPIIIHRDIKSSNILLTDKYVAKVADFGLSRLGPEESSGATHVSTVVKGTAGYLDPEFWSTNHLSERSDVFSFGVVLLEVLCGRQPINNGLPDKSQSNIVEWVRNSLLAGDIESILDPAVRDCHPNMDSVWKVAELAIQCVEPRGIHRPWMRDVVKELREAIVLEDGDSGALSEMDRSNNIGTSSTPAPYMEGNSDDVSLNFEHYRKGPQVR